MYQEQKVKIQYNVSIIDNELLMSEIIIIIYVINKRTNSTHLF